MSIQFAPQCAPHSLSRFWVDHSAYVLELQSLQTEAKTLKARYEHDKRELEKLQKTNVYCRLSQEVTISYSELISQMMLSALDTKAV